MEPHIELSVKYWITLKKLAPGVQADFKDYTIDSPNKAGAGLAASQRCQCEDDQ
jgi:hypothetical protein